MGVQQEILDRIPHRPPFLWVDEILEHDDTTIVTRKTIPTDLDLFQGHYPDNPIMPGVLLCEAIFQSGALLMSYLLEDKSLEISSTVPVLTRIEVAKFKRMVAPGDTVNIKVSIKETLGSVSFMKGTLRVDGKVAVQVDFSCALTSPR
ncbi:3-hydroxyacyl-ACP dehydratase FabZ [Desulfopila aestuarii]|uniref:3-hydroxyacyl-[acyl-carrier-protein] dehydratase n=1 Tax=Desulfopila aestuarii DSM 18488 TaxID=1121416 RepID=A0A1M7Y2F6_9BACT|nr:3-hydroxyacyl-ACP dehydratase FabZ [Desulfopila aestuarii]SHO45884.1 3-hydroxyacyl-[acyl-carrier-protein] dehydratase [Desulfopila aestuarii DSM 18488]